MNYEANCSFFILLQRRAEPAPPPCLHRKYRSIVGCLSYLVNMTRPDLAFSFSQLSKFLQCPGDAHLAAAYRMLAYVKGTLNQGLSYHDPGVGKRNTLSGWVDSDFASDIDTRKSVTGYLMVLNGGPVSWKASRQGGVKRECVVYWYSIQYVEQQLGRVRCC